VRPRIFLLCLLASGCAGETQERPRLVHPEKELTREPVVDPETAFVSPATEPRQDRFETRRIGATRDGTTTYRGAPVDLDVKGADIHDVCRLIADVGHVNIVVAGEVTGTVTLKLKRIPWDQALDVVMKTRGLVAEREGNVIVVRASSR
jgi:type II secretory pathway component HofQ